MIEFRESISPEQLYVIQLLTNDRISKVEKIEQLKAYAYALTSDQLRKELDDLDALKSHMKAQMIIYMKNAKISDEILSTALMNIDEAFSEFYFRLIFIALAQRELFKLNDVKNVTSFEKMRKSVADKLNTIVLYYVSDKNTRSKFAKLLENYVSGGGER